MIEEKIICIENFSYGTITIGKEYVQTNIDRDRWSVEIIDDMEVKRDYPIEYFNIDTEGKNQRYCRDYE